MKKFIFTFITCIIVMLCMYTPAFAENFDTPVSENQEQDLVSDTESQDATISKQIKDLLSEHIGEIFCTLTFVGSCLTAILYKKGLMPSVSNSLALINKNASSVFKRIYEYSENTDTMVSDLCHKTENALACISDFSEKVLSVTKDTKELSNEVGKIESDGEKLKKIITMQNEMLYTIFMSSSIPQYQKDSIGEVYEKIKRLSSED